ncbi:MAG TPA: hypothetical protein VL625_11595 [Patescibacteria group bacterium]|nr:hypothetical protein [Patescibacteria group bacterium]
MEFSLKGLFKKMAEVRDDLAFKLDLGASWGPSKAVQDELAPKGWSFRSEIVAMPGVAAESLHPVLNGTEIRQAIGGKITPEWEQYETDRLTAVYKVHNRPLPAVLDVPKAGTMTWGADLKRRFNHWAARNEVLGPDPRVTEELENQGWTFRKEVVHAFGGGMPVAAEVLHPVPPKSNAELERGTAGWDQYETARMAAVDKLFGKPGAPSCGCG